MVDVLLGNERELQVQVEAAKGTLETPETDGSESKFRIMNARIEPAFEFADRDLQKIGGSKSTKIRENQVCNLSFRLEIIRGSALAADAPPPWAKLLRACGFKETVTASTSVAYQRVSDPGLHPSLSMWLSTGNTTTGRRHALRGCVGNVDFIFEAGKVCYMDFTFTGTYVGTADIALAAVVHIAGLPPVWESASMSFGGTAMVIRSINLRMNNVIAWIRDANYASGLRNAVVTGRDIGGDLSAQAQLVASHDIWADFNANTERALTFGVGSRINFSMPAVQLTGMSDDEADNLSLDGAEFSCNEGDEATPGDELVITLT